MRFEAWVFLSQSFGVFERFNRVAASAGLSLHRRGSFAVNENSFERRELLDEMSYSFGSEPFVV
jgi:hypothetical protein